MISPYFAGHIGIANVTAYAVARASAAAAYAGFDLEMTPYRLRVNAIAPGYFETPFTQEPMQ